MAGQESKVTPRGGAEFELGLKTRLWAVQSFMVCLVAALPRSNHVSMLGEKNQGLALFNRVLLLWGNSPWG